MTLPLVSIIIPTYNQAEYLAACVDHCLFQTYPNLEIIIVDGGSTDQTKAYLALLSDRIVSSTLDSVRYMSEEGKIIRTRVTVYPQNRDVKIYVFDENIGATKTYNEGLKKISGKYCTYIVGDDLPHPHMIEEMVDVLENNNVDFVYSDMNLIDDNGSIVRQMLMPDYNLKTCLADWFHLGVSKLYRAELHEKVGLMDEKYTAANDYDHYLRFAMAGCRFFHLQRILYSIRWHGPKRKTGQHTSARYTILMEESKICAFRARKFIDEKEN
jgi:glycosyltransferase involved in cell wall biosynthesis